MITRIIIKFDIWIVFSLIKQLSFLIWRQQASNSRYDVDLLSLVDTSSTSNAVIIMKNIYLLAKTLLGI